MQTSDSPCSEEEFAEDTTYQAVDQVIACSYSVWQWRRIVVYVLLHDYVNARDNAPGPARAFQSA